MALTIKNLKYNGIGTLRVYIYGGTKSTMQIECNRFEAEKRAKELSSLYGGELKIAYYNGIKI